jgi:YggT family protein
VGFACRQRRGHLRFAEVGCQERCVAQGCGVPGGRLNQAAAAPAVGAQVNRMRVSPMYSLLALISTVIQIYIYILIASAVLSWLIAFNVVNTRNQAVAMIADVLWRLTEPVLRPIRNILPNFGGLDISPVVLILLLYFIRSLLFELFYGIVT